MKHLSMQSAGQMPAVEGMHVVVLYDGTTGRICHMHHVITFAGGSRYDHAHHESNARAYAGGMGHDPESLHCLHVSDFRPFAKAYRVDLQSKTLVADHPPPRPNKK